MKKRLGQTVVLATAATVFAGAANAELNYDFLELRYVDAELDAGSNDVDGDGFEFGGSYKIADNVHLFGGYQTLDFDGVDVNALQIGGGYMTAISADTDLVARLSYIDGEVEAGGLDFDDSGFGLSAGFRRMFTPEFEGRIFVNYADLDDSGSDTTLELAGDYYFNNQFAAGLSLDFGDDATSWSIGGRYFFGAGR
ncbi:hypothetical protein [Woeseia oceani]|uniref:Outer membrane protein beta-barrel domain-containing protein n=1 Tax=Woeseia oceani TaxID=1548547 RepID=A0A193LIH8_9GAMM|nr:hypothetical protein [Woeseia oceani]ANO52307.1 hypothetical protein BA177_14925 [Woeseia oceani]